MCGLLVGSKGCGYGFVGGFKCYLCFCVGGD